VAAEELALQILQLALAAMGTRVTRSIQLQVQRGRALYLEVAAAVQVVLHTQTETMAGLVATGALAAVDGVEQ
jgi:hypothetical protein